MFSLLVRVKLENITCLQLSLIQDHQERDSVLEWRPSRSNLYNSNLAVLCHHARVSARKLDLCYHWIRVCRIYRFLGRLRPLSFHPPREVQMAFPRNEHVLRSRHALHDDLGSGHREGCWAVDDTRTECAKGLEEFLVADDGGYQPDGRRYCCWHHQW